MTNDRLRQPRTLCCAPAGRCGMATLRRQSGGDNEMAALPGRPLHAGRSGSRAVEPRRARLPERAALVMTAVAASLLAACSPLPRPDASAPDIAALAETNDWPALMAARRTVAGSSAQPLLETRLAAARLDETATRRWADNVLRTGSASERSAALSALAGVEFARGGYARAAATADRWIASLEEDGASDGLLGARQLRSTALLLASAPQQRIDAAKDGAAPLWRDKVGLVRAPAQIGDVRIEAVLDTGANLSVIRRSLAKRLGIRFIAGTAAVGSSTVESVDIEVAVADRMAFAGATLHDVAFIVLNDDALSFPVPGGYDIDAIIGFPVFLALERIAFRPDRFEWGNSLPASGSIPLFANGSDLYIETLVDGRPVALHLDTGAARTELTAWFARRFSAYRANALAERSVSGAGGTAVGTVAKVPALEVRIGDWAACARDVDLALGDPTGIADHHLGRLGQDIVGQAGWFRLDLGQMRADIGGDRDGARRIARRGCRTAAPDGSNYPSGSPMPER